MFYDLIVNFVIPLYVPIYVVYSWSFISFGVWVLSLLARSCLDHRVLNCIIVI